MTPTPAKHSAAAALAMVDGLISPLEEARLVLADRGFLFGEAIFETMLVRQSTPVYLQDHLERLKKSVTQLGWTLDFAKLVNDIATLCAASTTRAALKIIVSSGSEANFESDHGGRSNVYLLLTPLAVPTDQDATESTADGQAQCLRLLSLPDPRAEIGVRIKTTGYLPNAQALQLARSQGYNDALFYDQLNNFSEATSAAFVWLSRRGDLRAAPAGRTCFGSITVDRLARALPHPKVSEKNMNRKALNLASAEQECVAAVLVSSVRGARPIGEIVLPGPYPFALDSAISCSLSRKINSFLEFQ